MVVGVEHLSKLHKLYSEYSFMASRPGGKIKEGEADGFKICSKKRRNEVKMGKR